MHVEYIIFTVYIYAVVCTYGTFQSRDATRSLANSSSSAKMKKSSASSANAGAAGSVVASGSGAVIASLRGKIHSLERALREKESALAAMKREVNVTSLRELEIQCEVYCEEINRYVCLSVISIT